MSTVAAHAGELSVQMIEPDEDAAEAEFASWRDVMLWDRDMRCVAAGGDRHHAYTDAVGDLYLNRSYWYVCADCDHHSPFPF